MTETRGWFQTPDCPWCGGETEAEFVDVEVGWQQVTPAVCPCCLAVQIGPYEAAEVLAKATPEERKNGFWKPPPIPIECKSAE